MPVSLWFRTASAAFLLLPAAVLAQLALPAQDTCIPGRPNVPFGPAVMVGGAYRGPYTVVSRSTFDQKLADGTTTHYETQALAARSTAGKTSSQNRAGCQLGPDGNYHFITSVSVADPASKTSMSWSMGAHNTNNVIYLNHQHPLMVLPRIKPDPPTPQLRAAEAALARETIREDLGHRSIIGYDAVGTRTTRNIPPGEEGNTLRLTIVDERWMSVQTRLALLITHDDPRDGLTTTEVTALDLNEPDPSLFQQPADYQIVDPQAAPSPTRQ